MSAQSGEASSATYDVEGVLLPRPFKIRRLGHFGVDLDDMQAGLRFYVDDLGFRITDKFDLSRIPRAAKLIEGAADPHLYFTSHGSDHHAFLLNERKISQNMGVSGGEVTVNQLTWQVGSLQEVVDGHDFLLSAGVDVVRIGRDMPGGNWHVYFRDTDGHQNELYYGMEQVGWQRRSRPLAMYDRGFRERPKLPQISEATEIEQAIARGVDIDSGHRGSQTADCTHEVAGILLPRPFKITRIGPVGIFVEDVDRSVDFYSVMLGFRVTETTTVAGQRCVFLRAGTEHHVLALFPKALRSQLGLQSHSTLAMFGLEVGSYRQLRDAVTFLKERGWQFLTNIPGDLYPGIDFAAFVLDPEGHCMMLYYYMEQIGWDGQPRPASERRKIDGEWPEVILAMSDTYVDQTFPGPLG